MENNINNNINLNYLNTGWESFDLATSINDIGNLASSTKIKSYKTLEGGSFNKIILAETNSEQFIIKISPLWNKGGLDREHWFYKKVNTYSTKIKTPHVLSYTPYENNILPGHAILILEYISGHILTDTDLDRENTHHQIATFLKTTHRVPGKGYGWLNDCFEGTYTTWEDFLLDIDNLEYTRESGLLPAGQINEVLSSLREKCNISFKPSLLYGDLNKGNILIHNDDLFIIDFENCFSGHPLYDLGIGAFFIPKIMQLLPVYINSPSRLERQQILLYALRHAISTLGHRIMVKDKKGICESTDRFYQLKDDFLKL